jgi:serine/threonine-protein kinase HipA
MILRHSFEGLFGIFNDSLPDGWGRLLLDLKLMSAGLNPGNLSPLDRLCFVRTSGMGALSYEPENPSAISHITNDISHVHFLPALLSALQNKHDFQQLFQCNKHE